MTEVNFVWHGDDFRYIDYLVLKSHIKVGHVPVLWFSGKKPNTPFWKDTEKAITIKDADTIFDVRNFLATGGNHRTAADMWRFHFLYSLGGIYCDTDVFALKKFPDDAWIVCAGGTDPKVLSISIIKAPPKQEVFQECIRNIKKVWGNVELFSNTYGQLYGNTNPTHNNKLFYPYPWTESYKLIKNIPIPWDSYSIHYAAKALSDFMVGPKWKTSFRFLAGKKAFSVKDLNEKWCKDNPDTMLGQLWKWIES